MSLMSLRFVDACVRQLIRLAPNAFASAVLFVSSAHAHEVFPLELDLRPGASGFIYVLDKSVPLCAADITAASMSGDVTVCAIDMSSPGLDVLLPGCLTTTPNRIDQVFRVSVSPTAMPSSTTVNISWIGEHFGGVGPCQENNTAFPTMVGINIRNDPVSAGNQIFAAPIVDPISAATGAYLKTAPLDLSLGGTIPVVFGRHYDSMLLVDGNFMSTLGPNWLHTYDWFADISATSVEILTSTGRVIRFKQEHAQTDWDLDLYEDVPFQLVHVGAEFILGDPNSGKMYVFDDTTGLLLRIEDGKGNQLALTYSTGLLQTVSDGLGRALTFTYTLGNLLMNVTDGARTIDFTYLGGVLSTSEDALDKLTAYSYDAGQPAAVLMTQCTAPGGNAHTLQTYNLSGQAITQVDAEMNATTVTYDTPATGDTTVLDPLSNAKVLTHSDSGQLTGLQDEAMETGSLGHDGAGRRTSITDRLGTTTSWTFDPASGLVATFNSAGVGTTTITRTARVLANGLTFYDVTGVTHPDATSEAFTHDASGNVLTWTDRRMQTWTMTYNARGQALTIENPCAGTTMYTYNADGTAATTTTHAMDTTTYGYDPLLRLNLITYADATTEALTYDAMDRVTNHVNEKAQGWTGIYDDNGNLTDLNGPLGSTLDFVYDDLDRLRSVMNALGHVTEMSYDELGRLKAILDANSNGVTANYDARGNRTSVLDGENKDWLRTYDEEGVLLTETNPLGFTTTYQTNVLGRITRVTSELGNQSLVTYDNMGRIRSLVDGAGDATQYSYDANGHITGIQLPMAGMNVTYTRNCLGQITGINDLAGEDWTYTCDPVGRLISAMDPLTNEHMYDYDTRGRLTLVTYPGGMGTQTLAYDDAGRLTDRNYSDGTTTSYVHDDLNRLTDAGGAMLLYNAGNQIGNSNGMTVVRDPAGRILSILIAPGLTVSYGYDNRNLCTSISDTLGGNTIFTYDDAGQLLTETHDNGLVTTYQWDADGRLDWLGHGVLADITLVRDGAGRVTEATRIVPETGLPTIGDLDLTAGSAGQVASFTYDALGSRTVDGLRTYTWNLAKQLEDYTEAMNTVSFTYDGFGMPVSRTEAATTRDYVWNYAVALPSISIEREMGADVRYYVHAPGGALIYSIDAATGDRHMYHYDEFGNTLFLSDDMGAVTDSYEYDPFGNILSSTESTDNAYTWQGRYGVRQEGATGLYSMRARWYDAGGMSFLTRDPLPSPIPWQLHSYQYANGSPTQFIDPLGTRPGVAVRQVMIEAKIVTANLDFNAQIGLNWDLGSNMPNIPASGSVSPELTTVTDGILNTLAFSDVSVFLRALTQADVSRVVQAPKLLSLDNSEATIFVGETVRYAQASGGGGRLTLSSPSQAGAPRDIGILLHVVPHVTPDDQLIMSLVPIPTKHETETHRRLVAKYRKYQSERTRNTLNGIVVPELSASQIVTQVLIRNGETAVLGGLLTQRRTQVSGIPWLSKIPVVSYLFSRQSPNAQKEELIIFITPRVIKDV